MVSGLSVGGTVTPPTIGRASGFCETACQPLRNRAVAPIATEYRPARRARRASSRMSLSAQGAWFLARARGVSKVAKTARSQNDRALETRRTNIAAQADFRGREPIVLKTVVPGRPGPRVRIPPPPLGLA